MNKEIIINIGVINLQPTYHLKGLLSEFCPRRVAFTDSNKCMQQMEVCPSSFVMIVAFTLLIM